MVCVPSESSGSVHGPVTVTHSPSSMRHSMCPPVSGVVIVTVGVLSLVGPAGPPIVTPPGAVVSIVIVIEVSSPALPAAST